MKKAFSLIEVFLVVAIMGVLAAIAFPNFISMKSRVDRDRCINNLRQIKLAKEQWALENDKDADDVPPTAEDLDSGGYIKDGTAGFICPKDTQKTFAASYDINDVNTDPACKISPSDHKL